MEEQRKAFESGMQRRGPRREFTPPKEILAKFDKDGDGKLSDSEKTKLIQDPEVQDMMKRMIGNPPPRFGE